MKRAFHSWIPPKLDLWLLLLLSTILSFTNGIPTTLATYILSDQAGIPADMTMASYAYYTGMACAIPLVFRMSSFTSKRNLLIGVHLSLLFLNFILAHTTVSLSVVMACFGVGFIKIFGSVGLLGELMPLLMHKGERYEMYCVYYPLAILVPALSGIVAIYIADSFHWEVSFHFQNFLLFIGLLIVILFMHSNDRDKRIPLYQYDWLGSILLSAALLVIAYTTTYGLTENWFHSYHIIIGAVASVGLILLFLHRNLRVRKPLFRFEVFKLRALPITIGTLFFLGIFYSSSSLISSFNSIIVPGYPVKSAEISNYYVMGGYIVGSIFTYQYFKRTKDCRFIFAFSCLCYLICNVWLYLLVSPQTAPVQLAAPLFFRGMGLMVSYITAGVYLGGNVPVKAFLPCVAFLIFVRSYLVPIVWSNILANWYYHRQLINLNHLAGGMDKIDPLVLSRGTGIARTVQTQASMLAVRDILGALNVVGLVLLVVIFLFPYHSSRIRRIFNWRDSARSKEMAQALPV